MAITTFNTNIAAFGAQRNIKLSSAATQSSLSKLSSGLRVPTAKDDAAALAIGSNLRAEVAGLKQASVNAGQASSLLQIAEGAMSQVGEILIRLKSLAVQASSGQLSSTDRSTLDAEFQALTSEIDRISGDAEFNGTKLVSASTTTAADRLTTGANITNLIGEGFESISFADSFGSGAVEFTFDAATDILTAKNLVTQSTQSISIGSTAITAGQTQSVNFNSLGVSAVLNSNFDKTTNIAGVNTAAAADGTEFTTGQIEAATISITSGAVDTTAATTATTLDFGAFDTSVITITGAAATATLSLGGFNEDGSATTLTGTVDLTSLGTKTVSLDDANGNAVNIEFNVTTVYAGTGVTPADNTIVLAELGQVVGSNSLTATSTSFDFKIGTGVVAAEDTITFAIDAISTGVLGLSSSDILTAGNADNAISAVNNAISTLSGSRAAVGAVQSRLDFASNNLAVSIENSEAARSALLDVDVAEEITNFTTKQVLLQAGVAMLSQANQLPQNLLQLLR